MSWRHLFDPYSFDRARRREAYRRFTRAVRREPGAELLPLTEVERRLAIFERAYVGVEAIPVAKIVGSADRTEDFDRDFLPRRDDVKQKWQEIERAFPTGDFPPVVVYQVGDAYFVVDGHHRVAVAKHKDVEFIDAEVTRLHTRFDLPSDADIGYLIRAEQQRIFMEESALERARPEARIEFSRPDGYPELLDVVKVHGYHRMLEEQRLLAPEEAAGDWYDRIYLPTVDAIRAERLPELLPHATEADIFLSVYQRRRELFPELGAVSLEEIVTTVGEEGRIRQGRQSAKARRTVRRMVKPPSRREKD